MILGMVGWKYILFTLCLHFCFSVLFIFLFTFLFFLLFTILYKIHQLFLANFLSLTSVSTKYYIALHCMYKSTYHFSVSQYKDPHLHQGINLNAATSFLQHKCLNLISVLLIFLQPESFYSLNLTIKNTFFPPTNIRYNLSKIELFFINLSSSF